VSARAIAIALPQHLIRFCPTARGCLRPTHVRCCQVGESLEEQLGQRLLRMPPPFVPDRQRSGHLSSSGAGSGPPSGPYGAAGGWGGGALPSDPPPAGFHSGGGLAGPSGGGLGPAAWNVSMPGGSPAPDDWEIDINQLHIDSKVAVGEGGCVVCGCVHVCVRVCVYVYICESVCVISGRAMQSWKSTAGTQRGMQGPMQWREGARRTAARVADRCRLFEQRALALTSPRAPILESKPRVVQQSVQGVLLRAGGGCEDTQGPGRRRGAVQRIPAGGGHNAQGGGGAALF
jgi:hypothetical protein